MVIFQMYYTSKSLDPRLTSLFQKRTDPTSYVSAKAEEAIFIGYEKGTKNYKFWSPKQQRVVISSTATFDEFTFPFCAKKPDDKPPSLSQMTAMTFRSLTNQTNLNHQKTFRSPTIINVHHRKMNTPIHRSLQSKVLMISSHLDLLLLIPILNLLHLIIHHLSLPLLMMQKNLDTELEFAIPAFFPTTHMEIELQ